MKLHRSIVALVPLLLWSEQETPARITPDASCDGIAQYSICYEVFAHGDQDFLNYHMEDCPAWKPEQTCPAEGLVAVCNGARTARYYYNRGANPFTLESARRACPLATVPE